MLIIAIVGVIVIVVVALVVVLAFLAIPKPPVTPLARTMTASEFTTELSSWGSSQGQFPTLSPGETVVVSGTITDITSSPFSSGSMVTLDGTAFLLPINLPGACNVGDRMSVTLHIVTITQGGQTAEWIQELGSAGNPDITLPASAVRCV